MANRFYSSVAVETQLSASITASDMSLTVDDTTGFPVSFPYVLILDPETSSEEAVEVSSAAGGTLNVTRGVDSTPAIGHSAGARVIHGFTARDFREPQDHLSASTAIHGLAGGSSVVGTDETQTLANKTLTSPTIGDFTNAGHDHGTVGAGGNVPQAAVTGLETRLGDIESVNTTQDSTLSDHGTRITDNEAQLSDHEIRITDIETETPEHCKVELTANENIPINTSTAIPWDVATFNSPSSMWSGTTPTKIIIPEDGFYAVTVFVDITSLDEDQTEVLLRVNGSTLTFCSYRRSATFNLSPATFLAALDEIEVFMFCLSSDRTVQTNSFCEVVRVA